MLESRTQCMDSEMQRATTCAPSTFFSRGNPSGQHAGQVPPVKKLVSASEQCVTFRNGDSSTPGDAVTRTPNGENDGTMNDPENPPTRGEALSLKSVFTAETKKPFITCLALGAAATIVLVVWCFYAPVGCGGGRRLISVEELEMEISLPSGRSHEFLHTVLFDYLVKHEKNVEQALTTYNLKVPHVLYPSQDRDGNHRKSAIKTLAQFNGLHPQLDKQMDTAELSQFGQYLEAEKVQDEIIEFVFGWVNKPEYYEYIQRERKAEQRAMRITKPNPKDYTTWNPNGETPTAYHKACEKDAEREAQRQAEEYVKGQMGGDAPNEDQVEKMLDDMVEALGEGATMDAIQAGVFDPHFKMDDNLWNGGSSSDTGSNPKQELPALDDDDDEF